MLVNREVVHNPASSLFDLLHSPSPLLTSIYRQDTSPDKTSLQLTIRLVISSSSLWEYLNLHHAVPQDISIDRIGLCGACFFRHHPEARHCWCRVLSVTYSFLYLTSRWMLILSFSSGLHLGGYQLSRLHRKLHLQPRRLPGHHRSSVSRHPYNNTKYKINLEEAKYISQIWKSGLRNSWWECYLQCLRVSTPYTSPQNEPVTN